TRDRRSRRCAHSRLGAGSYVNARAVIGGATTIGRFVFINRAANIGHHVDIADFASVGPGATVAGAVRIGCGAVVAAGADRRVEGPIPSCCRKLTQLADGGIALGCGYDASNARRDYPQDFSYGSWTAEKVALHFGATRSANDFELPLGLDAFGRCGHIETA